MLLRWYLQHYFISSVGVAKGTGTTLGTVLGMGTGDKRGE